MSNELKTLLHSSLITHHFFMEPEIARRCKACGAAIRMRATFCPQCGKSVEGANSGAVSQAPPVPAEPPSLKRTDAGLPALQPARPAPTVKLEERVPDIKGETERSEISSDRQDAHAGSVASRMADDAALKRRRATEAARGAVKENLLPRAEKFRHVSSAVLDEASVDPSLRFVLVAAGLFILFLVFLFLSLWR